MNIKIKKTELAICGYGCCHADGVIISSGDKMESLIIDHSEVDDLKKIFELLIDGANVTIIEE